MKKWTYETCYYEAKKYECASDFKKECCGAYCAARRNRWLKDYVWFVPKNKKWTYDLCFQIASRYNRKKDFREKEPNAYITSCVKGYLKLFSWLKPEVIAPTFCECYNESKKYTCKKDFVKGNCRLYTASNRNGWLEMFSWLRDERFDILTDKIDSVYCYLFKELNAVYVGRTMMRSQKKRDREHIFSNDSVSSFAKEHNIPVPSMTILQECLTIKEGADKEGEWLEYYKRLGYHILNRTKTGSIGMLGKGKWNKHRCLELAKTCSCSRDMKVKSKSAYNRALREGWINTYTWFVKPLENFTKWDRNSTFEEAKKYRTKLEFEKSNKAAYNSACRNGWMKDYKWLQCNKSPKYWDIYENTYNEALKYNNRSAFCNGSQSAYQSALRNGWLELFTWFVKPKHYCKWNKKATYIEAKKYSTRTEFARKSNSAYNSARKNGWLETYKWLRKQ